MSPDPLSERRAQERRMLSVARNVADFAYRQGVGDAVAVDHLASAYEAGCIAADAWEHRARKAEAELERAKTEQVGSVPDGEFVMNAREEYERALRAEAERDLLMAALWDCYRISGADTDGDTRWHCTPAEAALAAVDAVRELRTDYEDDSDLERVMNERDLAVLTLAAFTPADQPLPALNAIHAQPVEAAAQVLHNPPSSYGVHTCHVGCPCHEGGRPVPDFIEREESE